MFKIMVTGHRPNKIGGYCEDNPIRISIYNKFIKLLSDYKEEHKKIIGISGMAQGCDQDFCRACMSLNVPYNAYVPFCGQESFWPFPAQEKYNYFLGAAQEVIIVSKGNYTPQKMMTRNMAMADVCNIAIAVWDGSKGGTCNCVQYLQKINKEIIRINSKIATDTTYIL